MEIAVRPAVPEDSAAVHVNFLQDQGLAGTQRLPCEAPAPLPLLGEPPPGSPARAVVACMPPALDPCRTAGARSGDGLKKALIFNVF